MRITSTERSVIGGVWCEITFSVLIERRSPEMVPGTTSSAAPAMRSFESASIAAFSSTIGPRAVLTRTRGFHLRNCVCADKVLRFRSVRTVKMVTISLSLRVSKETGSRRDFE